MAAQEVVAYQLARQAVSDLIASNATFGACCSPTLAPSSARCRSAEASTSCSLSPSRVDEAFLRPAHFVDASTDILSVVKLFQLHRTSNVLVRDPNSVPPRLGIFTATALQRAILDGSPLDQLAVG